MPAQYEAIRDRLLSQGKSRKEAERIAAATFNSRRPKGAPSLNDYVQAEKEHRPLAQFQPKAADE